MYRRSASDSDRQKVLATAALGKFKASLILHFIIHKRGRVESVWTSHACVELYKETSSTVAYLIKAFFFSHN